MWFPADWPSPIASAHPYAPGASSTPRVIRSTWATGSAPAPAAAAASSGAGSRQPKKLGCGKIAQAAPSQAAANRSGSVVPPVCGTSTTSMPKPGANVRTTWRTCGLSVWATTTRARPVVCLAT